MSGRLTALAASLAAVVISVGEVAESGAADCLIADAARVDLRRALAVEAFRSPWYCRML